MSTTTLDDSFGILSGTSVYAADDEKLGIVVGADPYELVVEHGFLLVHDHRIQLADVDRWEDGKLVLRLTKDQVARQGEQSLS